MTTLLRDQRRGAEAKRLLEEPMLAEAFASLDAQYREAWAATGDAQERERERLWLMVKLLARVQRHLEAIVSDGALASAELEKDIRDAA